MHAILGHNDAPGSTARISDWKWDDTKQVVTQVCEPM
jgi:hypothetical protein